MTGADQTVPPMDAATLAFANSVASSAAKMTGPVANPRNWSAVLRQGVKERRLPLADNANNRAMLAVRAQFPDNFRAVWTRTYYFSSRLDDVEARRWRVRADNTLDESGTHIHDAVVEVAAAIPMTLERQPTKQDFWRAVKHFQEASRA
jgi:hypothetical protein